MSLLVKLKIDVLFPRHIFYGVSIEKEILYLIGCFGQLSTIIFIKIREEKSFENTP